VERETMIREDVPPLGAWSATPKWGSIFAGLIVGLVSQTVLAASGLAVGLAILSRSSPHAFVGLAVGMCVWLCVSLAVAAYLAGRTTAGAARHATSVDRTFNALITGMLLFLMLTGYSFGTVFRSLGMVSGVAGSVAGIFSGGGSSQTRYIPQQPSNPTLITSVDAQSLSLVPPERAEAAHNLSIQPVRARSGKSGSSTSTPIPKWLMPIARKAAAVGAGIMGIWLLTAAILLGFAALGGSNVSWGPTLHRSVRVQRQRAATPSG
jgi:hypothetical protein